MNWIRSKSVDELKKLGKFRDVKQMVKDSCEGLIEIKARGWNDLYKKINKIYDFFNSIEISNANVEGETKEDIVKENVIKDNIDNKEILVEPNDSRLFTSEASEYIFYLLELDGEARLKKLKVTKTHYSNKEKAKKWKNDIAKVIHYDKCHHPLSDEATSMLMDIYRGMIGNEG